MAELERFQIVGDRAEFRPAGETTTAQAILLVTRAIQEARRRSVQKLLVHLGELRGLESPPTLVRYFMAAEWARAAGGAVRLVVVVSPELIDPGKIGIKVAALHGTVAGVFASETEAIAWLDAPVAG